MHTNDQLSPKQLTDSEAFLLLRVEMLKDKTLNCAERKFIKRAQYPVDFSSFQQQQFKALARIFTKAGVK